MTGTKVERIYAHGVTALENFVVGRVLSAERHPDADRLTVCMVALGEGDTAQIVCGAPNVAEGQTVAVARPGRGHARRREAQEGQAARRRVRRHDPRRGRGRHRHAARRDHGARRRPAARDAARGRAPDRHRRARARDHAQPPRLPEHLRRRARGPRGHPRPFAPPPWADDPLPPDGEIPGFSVEVRDPELCPRFTARLYEDVKLAPSPPWLKARLMAAGQRPINERRRHHQLRDAVLGPADARLRRRPRGRRAPGRAARATDGETMTTLDDVERRLDAEMVVIDDAEGPTSIAGVMGGACARRSTRTPRAC